uniref:Ig-like domain-containing protein n=1 Tax=Nothobranchius furzeri TaxID=105023 RepID=A0A8C6NYQ9_NOTFU
MESVSLRTLTSGSAVVFFNTLALSWTGKVEPAAKIDGWQQSAVTLQENMTHRFSCQLDGWDPRAPPLLTWYLNGKQQEPNPGRLLLMSQKDPEVVKPRTNPNNTFFLQARKWDRELVCVASNPRTGKSYNATVMINVQCKSGGPSRAVSKQFWFQLTVSEAALLLCVPVQPEILWVNTQYSETSDPGLFLLLLALVRSNPPATLTFVDQWGHLVANTSDFLILDSRSYPWLTNHTLKVSLSSLTGNVMLNASNSVGAADRNLTLSG